MRTDTLVPKYCLTVLVLLQNEKNKYRSALKMFFKLTIAGPYFS